MCFKLFSAGGGVLVPLLCLFTLLPVVSRSQNVTTQASQGTTVPENNDVTSVAPPTTSGQASNADLSTSGLSSTATDAPLSTTNGPVATTNGASATTNAGAVTTAGAASPAPAGTEKPNVSTTVNSGSTPTVVNNGASTTKASSSGSTEDSLSSSSPAGSSSPSGTPESTPGTSTPPSSSMQSSEMTLPTAGGTKPTTKSEVENTTKAQTVANEASTSKPTECTTCQTEPPPAVITGPKPEDSLYEKFATPAQLYLFGGIISVVLVVFLLFILALHSNVQSLRKRLKSVARSTNGNDNAGYPMDSPTHWAPHHSSIRRVSANLRRTSPNPDRPKGRSKVLEMRSDKTQPLEDRVVRTVL